MSIPYYRPRRLRSNENIRRMVRETALSPADFIYPLVHDCEEVNSLGVPAVILFGIPEHKDELGCEAYDDRGIVQNAIRAIKERVPDLIVITDVCLCEYTSHGHCGVIKDGKVKNDPTLALLASTALSHAEPGADLVAP